jgi:hypothetical protein
MFFDLFESPIIDIILIILAIRYIFPSLFTFKVVRINQQQQQPTYRQNPEGSIHIKSSGKKDSADDDHRGEYIDYEEVK